VSLSEGRRSVPDCRVGSVVAPGSRRRQRFSARALRAAVALGTVPLGALALASVGLSAQAAATHTAFRTRCRLVVCKPVLTVEAGYNRSNIFGGPLVRSLTTNLVSRLPQQANLQLFFNAAVHTFIPRVGLFASFNWLPNASAGSNPYTQYTASELGSNVRANSPSFSVGASVAALALTDTHGWFGIGPYIDDLFSPAATPSATQEYTSKLEVGVTAQVGILNWLPAQTWTHRNISGFVTLDEIVTGVPSAGDQVPIGERVFLNTARPAIVEAGIAVQLAPL